MFTVSCVCGEKYYADQQHYGKSIKCRKCNRLIPIGPPEETIPADAPSSRGFQWIWATRRSTAEERFPPNASGSVGSSRGSPPSFNLRAGGIVLVLALGLLILLANLRSEKPPTYSPRTPPLTPELPPQRQSPASTSPPSTPGRSAASPKQSPIETRDEKLRPRPEAKPDGRRKLTLAVCAPSASASIRPPTGTELLLREENGFGQLEVSNGALADATLTLLTSDTPPQAIVHVYIRASERTSIEGIPPGTYRMLFAQGRQWDARIKRFQCDRSAAEFIDPAVFEELEVADGVKYTHARVTLHPVPGGRARTRPIDPDQFDEEVGELRGPMPAVVPQQR